ncbi:MAG: EamA family transporter [Cyclobacteriaceae bacterium]|nr:EamA family transporter [Cyclobacteriaceae bacterium HetDA_MAG_MS6]
MDIPLPSASTEVLDLKTENIGLFTIPAIIWGSTWFVIKFQLGQVDPLWSVSYRFVLAGLLLIGFLAIKGTNLRYPWTAHLRMALQGALLFGFNYWLVYLAELQLTSALVAVAFSTIIFLNIVFGTIFLKRKTDTKVYIGAIMGVAGTILIFYQQLKDVSYAELPFWSLIVCFLSVVVASLGNITSAANQSHNLPVLPTNGYGMIYGGLIMAAIAVFSSVVPTIDLSPGYLGSLLYLSVLGSIAAFGAYLTLIGKIGPDRAAYVLIFIPVIALIISVVFEGYRFEWFAGSGVILILGGNIIVTRK